VAVANADGSAGVDVDVRVGPKIPDLAAVAVVLVVLGLATQLLGAVALVSAVRGPEAADRRTPRP
jgi:hypothetical protein